MPAEYINFNVKSIESETESFDLKHIEKVSRLTKKGLVCYAGSLYKIEYSDRQDLPFIVIENPVKKMC